MREEEIICVNENMSSALTVTNLASKGQGKGEDINSSQENENSMLSL